MRKIIAVLIGTVLFLNAQRGLWADSSDAQKISGRINSLFDQRLGKDRVEPVKWEKFIQKTDHLPEVLEHKHTEKGLFYILQLDPRPKGLGLAEYISSNKKGTDKLKNYEYAALTDKGKVWMYYQTRNGQEKQFIMDGKLLKGQNALEAFRGAARLTQKFIRLIKYWK